MLDALPFPHLQTRLRAQSHFKHHRHSDLPTEVGTRESIEHMHRSRTQSKTIYLLQLFKNHPLHFASSVPMSWSQPPLSQTRNLNRFQNRSPTLNKVPKLDCAVLAPPARLSYASNVSLPERLLQLSLQSRLIHGTYNMPLLGGQQRTSFQQDQSLTQKSPQALPGLIRLVKRPSKTANPLKKGPCLYKPSTTSSWNTAAKLRSLIQ